MTPRTSAGASPALALVTSPAGPSAPVAPARETSRMRALLHELVDVACDVLERREPAPTDDLVPIALEPLAAIGLELKAILALVEAGHLRAVTIGRRRFTKKSLLLALVDELPHAARSASGPAPKAAKDERSELERTVHRAAMRRARRGS